MTRFFRMMAVVGYTIAAYLAIRSYFIVPTPDMKDTAMHCVFFAVAWDFFAFREKMRRDSND